MTRVFFKQMCVVRGVLQVGMFDHILCRIAMTFLEWLHNMEAGEL